MSQGTCELCHCLSCCSWWVYAWNGILKKSLLFSNNKEELLSLQLMVASTEQNTFHRVNKSKPMIKIFTAFAIPKELNQLNIKISSFFSWYPSIARVWRQWSNLHQFWAEGLLTGSISHAYRTHWKITLTIKRLKWIRINKTENLLSNNWILQKSLLFSNNKEELPSLQLMVTSTEQNTYSDITITMQHLGPALHVSVC